MINDWTSANEMQSPSVLVHPVHVRLSISHKATVLGQLPPAMTRIQLTVDYITSLVMTSAKI